MKNLRESYKLYKETVENPTDIQQYLLIAADYNKFLMDKVLKGKEVTLPSRMGTLSIVGRKQKIRFDDEGKVVGLAPDWVKTKELWDSNPKAKAEKKRVFHLNSGTGGVRYKFLWSKKHVLVQNKTLYSLRLTRTNKRAVHANILNGAQYKTYH
tara:strand:+ start:749 stop:1210 length:462 start_codon:yes stop_codon:yes gene_type:complete